jgi:hypothetical protein
MSPYRRYGGFLDVTPGHPSDPVKLSLDEGFLTVWTGNPENVWQTPLEEVGGLEVEIARRLTVRATVRSTRYAFSTPRGEELDDLIDTARSAGAHIVRRRRLWAGLAAAAAASVLLASVASIAVYLAGRVGGGSSTPSASQVASINVQRSDFASGWSKDSTGLLTVLTGTPGSVVRASPKKVVLKGLNKSIWGAITNGFQGCLGVSNAADRMYGAAGQQPAIQVSGNVLGSAVDGGTEIASVTQYYSSTTMVTKDLREYSQAGFGKCWAVAASKTLEGYTTDTAKAARATYVASSYRPVTFAHGFRSGGVATVTIPHVPGNYHLVALFAASGHYELNLFALTGKWPAAAPVVQSALEAMLARVASPTTPGSAA